MQEKVDIVNADKVIMRAIADVYINQPVKVRALINKYSDLPEYVSRRQEVAGILTLLSENNKFAEEFTALMIKTGALQTVRGTGEYKNAVGTIIAGVVSVVGGVAKKVLGNKQAKLEGENLSVQQQIETQEQMMKMIADAEKNKRVKQRTETAIAITAILAVFTVVGVVIYNKTKK